MAAATWHCKREGERERERGRREREKLWECCRQISISGALHTIYKQCSDLAQHVCVCQCVRVCVCVGRAKTICSTATAATKMFNNNNNNKMNNKQQRQQFEIVARSPLTRFYVQCTSFFSFLLSFGFLSAGAIKVKANAWLKNNNNNNNKRERQTNKQQNEDDKDKKRNEIQVKRKQCNTINEKRFQDASSSSSITQPGV